MITDQHYFFPQFSLLGKTWWPAVSWTADQEAQVWDLATSLCCVSLSWCLRALHPGVYMGTTKLPGNPDKRMRVTSFLWKGGINCGWRGVARIFQSRGHTVLNREYSPHYQVNLHTVFYLIWHKNFTKGGHGHFRTPPPLALDLTWHYLYFCEGTRSNLEITRSILVWYWTILKVLFYCNRLVKLKAMK